MGGLPILLDHTPLRYAKRKLGGVAGSRGDAGDWEGWLCYHGTDSIGQWMLWLTSDEINGDAIGGFIWKRVETGDSVDSRCGVLQGPSAIELQLPLRLGMTRAQAAEVLGKPTSVRDSELFYLHTHEQMIKGLQYTISNGVETDAHAGTVVQIAAFEISSN